MPLETPPHLAADAALFLDFDGTLVEIADTPGGVVVPEALPGLLERLHAMLDGRLAIVSGRSVQCLREDFGLVGPVISGSHGLQISVTNGEIDAPEAPPALSAAAGELDEFVARHDGLLVERKPLGIGLHYRQAEALQQQCLEEANRIAEKYGLAMQAGKMVVELKVAVEADKGTAILRLMEEPRFHGAIPVFLGDDLTDEAGFRAVVSLGGHGVLVGAERESAASYRLQDVSAVHAWLRSEPQ